MNNHWEVINAGGQQIINTPKQLWEAVVKYFKWCDDNPIVSKRTLTSGKTQGIKVDVEYVRPYEIKAMCLHCNISERYIKDLKESHAVDSEWVMVMEKILYIIYNQNVEGAIVDLYNPIMVSKLIGLDKDNGSDSDKAPRVEIVDSTTKEIATSENEILENLDYGKVEILKEKAKNLKEQNLEKENIKDA